MNKHKDNGEIEAAVHEYKKQLVTEEGWFKMALAEEGWVAIKDRVGMEAFVRAPNGRLYPWTESFRNYQMNDCLPVNGGGI